MTKEQQDACENVGCRQALWSKTLCRYVAIARRIVETEILFEEGPGTRTTLAKVRVREFYAAGASSTLFCQQQFSIVGDAQAIEFTAMLDPDFTAVL